MLFNYRNTISKDEVIELFDWLKLEMRLFLREHGERAVYSSSDVRHYINKQQRITK